MSDGMKKNLERILLDYYHCTFFFPIMPTPGNEFVLSPKNKPVLYPLKDKNQQADKVLKRDERSEAQAFHFFSPILRKILFQQKPEADYSEDELRPMQEWRLAPSVFADWCLTLGQDADRKDPLKFQTTRFKAVTLYKYFNGIYLLAFRVEPTALSNIKNTKNPGLFSENGDAPQFFDASEHSEDYGKMQLEAWLRFTRLGRQLFRSFTEQWDEKKIAPIRIIDSAHQDEVLAEEFTKPMPLDLPDPPGAALSQIVRFLTQQFFDAGEHEKLNKWFDHHDGNYDDRMFVSVAYGLAGKPHTEDILHRVRTLIALTDRVDDTWDDFGTYPYNRQTTDPYIKQHEFNLWGDDPCIGGKGGYYYYTDMVNAYVYNGSFFRKTIAPVHIPYLYDRMMVQALFYQASLRHYDQEMTAKTQRLLKNKADTASSIETIRKQREGFIRFTNQYWFRELTHQMQGKAIFRLQQKGLDLNAYYQQIQNEIERTNEYLQVLHEERAANQANQLAEEANKGSRRANKLADLAIWIGIIAVLPVINDFYKTEDSLWQMLSSQLPYQHWLGSSAVLVIVAVLIYCIAMKFIRPKIKKWLEMEG